MTKSANAVVSRRPDPKAQYALIEQTVSEKHDAIVTTLPATVDPERFISVALQAVTRSPRLLECTPASVVKALRDAAELGLQPSGLIGSAYLVPYRNRRTNQYEAQLIAGYRGLIELARRSAEVRTFEAQIVRQRDAFDFQYGTGDNQYLRFTPYLNRDGERGPEYVDESGNVRHGELLDAGEYYAAWAKAVFVGGYEQFDVMSLKEILAIRARSKAASEGPWVTDFAEMARKTVARRLLKYLPLSATDLTRALEIEDAAEGTAVRVTASSPARERLQAALSPRDADDESNDDTQADESDAEAASDVASDDAEVDIDDAP